MNTLKMSKVGAAVAAVLGASSAFALNQTDTNAAPTQLVASGASAARDAFLLMFATELCQAGTVDVFRATPTSGQDFRAYSCTLVPSDPTPGTIGNLLGSVAGTNATLYYRAEGGSFWGPGAIVAKQQNGAFPGIKALDTTGTCAAPVSANYTIGATVLALPTWNCAVTGYDFTNDTFTSGALVDKQTQFGVSDVEPKMFVSTNYPQSTKFPQPIPAAFATALKNLPKQTAFGQSFGILVSNTGANTSGLLDLTKQQVTAIFSVGGYTNWNKIPGLAGGTITKVRREPGSGTQAATAAYFLGVNCGDNYNFVTHNGTTIFEENSTANLNNRISTTADSIGLTVFTTSPPSGTHFVSINGVSGDRANVQSGDYEFAYELTTTQATGLAGNTLTFANALTNIAKRAASIPDAPSVFAIPSSTNTPGSTVSGRPVARASRNGNSCLEFQGK